MKNWRTNLGALVGALGLAMVASTDARIHWGGVLVGIIAVTWFGYHTPDKQNTATNADLDDLAQANVQDTMALSKDVQTIAESLAQNLKK